MNCTALPSLPSCTSIQSLIPNQRELLEATDRKLTLRQVAFTIWDLFTSSPSELHLILKKPPARFNCLYFACRYSPIILLALNYVPWVVEQPTNHTTVIFYGASMIFLVIPLLVISQLLPHGRCWVYMETHKNICYCLWAFRVIVLCLQVLGIVFAGSLLPTSAELGCADTVEDCARVHIIGYVVLTGSSIDILGALAVVWYYLKDHQYRLRVILGSLIVQQTVISSSFVMLTAVVVVTFYTLGNIELRGMGLIVLVTFPNPLVCRWVLALRQSVSLSHTEQELSRIVHGDLASSNP
ncbi:hypothetical protein BDN72DRAFT_861203 [Pluteus cervinus]|uniref:Uncharacterized protein n=1 Tax=Pluteus cervinus TaxID=181527 RepID=A0ACD3AH56_9AGAR|nr:hypothetical protein BDN72DRAFT_861203 [Pluteus cervinus]